MTGTDDPARSQACRLRVHGHVQGVGYRWSLVREAGRLGLRGWVRNRLDGSVEALAAGPGPALQELVAWAHRGPPAARVSRVEVQPVGGGEATEARALAGFEQRPTA